MTISASIERIDIDLHGLSADLVQAAADGLDGELRRRLGDLPLGGRRGAGLAVAELALGPLAVPAGVDAAALRGLLAERICLALQGELQATGGEVG